MCEAEDSVIHSATCDAESVTPMLADTYVPNTQVNESLFNGLIDLMSDYEIWDIMDVVEALKLGDNRVWVNLKVKTIQQLLDETTDKLTLAKDVVPVVWLGGPPRLVDGEPKKKLMRGSLMHYVIDVILRQAVETQSKKPLVQVAASRLAMEG